MLRGAQGRVTGRSFSTRGVVGLVGVIVARAEVGTIAAGAPLGVPVINHVVLSADPRMNVPQPSRMGGLIELLRTRAGTRHLIS